MPSRSSPEPQKLGMENGMETGADEDSTCLDKGAGGDSQRMKIRAAKDRFVGDTRLSAPVRNALIALAVLCLILLIVVIALAVNWPHVINPSYICDAPVCLRLGAMLKERSSFKEDACKNTREWACGGWLRDNEHRIPGRSRWSLADEIEIQELRRLRDFVGAMGALYAPDSVQWKMKNMYQACMAVESVNYDGHQLLRSLIAGLGGWGVLRSDGWSENTWSWREALERLQAKHGVHPLFQVRVEWHNNETRFRIAPAPLGLPHHSYYMQQSDYPPLKAYKVLLKDTALNMDASTADATSFADDILNFEMRLATLMSEEANDEKEKAMTMKELNENGQFLPYLDILQAMFPRLTGERQLTDDTLILVTDPKYIMHLASITTSTTPRILNEFFIWTLIREYLPYLSQPYVLIWKEFQSHITGAQDEMARWEMCARLVRDTMPLAVGALLDRVREADRAVASQLDTERAGLTQRDPSRTTHIAETLDAVQTIFEDIKAAATDMVTSSQKLQPHMKALMLDQLNELKLQIGIPHQFATDEYLRTYHYSLAVQKFSLFNNVGYARDFKRDLDQTSYSNKDFFVITDNARLAVGAEAAYNSHTSTVVLPTPLTLPPYYHPHYPRSVQFGRLGAGIGEAVARALAIRDPEAPSAIPAYAADTIYCLDNALQEGRTSSVELSGAAYVRALGADLAARAARAQLDTRPYLLRPAVPPQVLLPLAYAQTLCSLTTEEQVSIDSQNLQIDGETMLKAVWPQIKEFSEVLGCRTNNACPAPL